MMKLPSIFVIGDSISIHYGPYLEAMVAGKFHYSRKSGIEKALENLDVADGANGGNSSKVLEYLKAILPDENFHPDWLLVNCGLHDIRIDRKTGVKEVSLENYKQNLREIVKRIKDKGIKLIFIRSTPVDENVHNKTAGMLRFEKDVDDYNAAADEIMAAAGVPTIDLFHFTKILGGSEVYMDHAHYHEHIRQLQAAYIAGCLDIMSQKL